MAHSKNREKWTLFTNVCSIKTGAPFISTYLYVLLHLHLNPLAIDVLSFSLTLRLPRSMDAGIIFLYRDLAHSSVLNGVWFIGYSILGYCMLF